MKKVVLSAVLLSLGTFAFAQQTPENREMKRQQMQQKMEMHQQQRLNEMKTQLNLTDDQVMRLKKLQQDNFENRKMDRMAAKKARKAKMEDMQGQMKKILTPEQYTKWHKMRKDKMMARKDKMMHRRHISPQKPQM